MTRIALLVTALTLTAACHNEDITAPEVYFDPTARGRLPDGYVFADSTDDAPASDVTDASDASDASDVTDASDASDASDVTDASDASDVTDASDQ